MITLTKIIKKLKKIDRFGIDIDGEFYTMKDAPFLLAKDLDVLIEKLETKNKIIIDLSNRLNKETNNNNRKTEQFLGYGCQLCGSLLCKGNCFK